jgi:DNA mismatch endonuclease (patch repair protein)
MAANKGQDTSIELLLRKELFSRGLRYRIHDRSLPGSPDIVFRRAKLAVFVDGDFWHGYRFPQWQHKLKDFWKKKIADNRVRDARNHARLRRRGWKVIRVWEHEVRSDLVAAANKIEEEVRART